MLVKSNWPERDPEQPLLGFGEGNADWVFVFKAFKQKSSTVWGKKKTFKNQPKQGRVEGVAKYTGVREE